MTPMRPLIAPLLALLLPGCLLAPGQHLRADALLHDHTPAGDDRIIPTVITPALIAMEEAERQRPALPDAISRYRPGPYRVGEGDTLYITVWDHPELTVPAGPQQQLNAAGRTVQSDGTLFYPYIGRIAASGRTLVELRQDITTRLAQFIEAPQVDVAVLGYASQRIWVTGASRQAATLPLTITPLTLADALSQSGLDPDQADLSGIRLTRDGRSHIIDLDRLSLQGDGGGPIFLKAGDHLHIPYLDHKEVFVIGEVNQPGALSFRTGGMSLSRALGRARGLQQTTADGKAVYVIRGAQALHERPARIFRLDARSPASFAVASRFQLQPGDVVFVGAAGVTRWSRLVNQLLPFTSIVSSAASAHNDLQDN